MSALTDAFDKHDLSKVSQHPLVSPVLARYLAKQKQVTNVGLLECLFIDGVLYGATLGKRHPDIAKSPLFDPTFDFIPYDNNTLFAGSTEEKNSHECFWSCVRRTNSIPMAIETIRNVPTWKIISHHTDCLNEFLRRTNEHCLLDKKVKAELYDEVANFWKGYREPCIQALLHYSFLPIVLVTIIVEYVIGNEPSFPEHTPRSEPVENETTDS
jgi:hypothetical protein